MGKAVTLKGNEVAALYQMLLEYFRRESFEFCNVAGKWDAPISEKIEFIEALAKDDERWQRIVFKLLRRLFEHNPSLRKGPDSEQRGKIAADKVKADANTKLNHLAGEVLPIIKKLAA